MRNILKPQSGTQSGTGILARKMMKFQENDAGGEILRNFIPKNLIIKKLFSWKSNQYRYFYRNGGILKVFDHFQEI